MSTNKENHPKVSKTSKQKPPVSPGVEKVQVKKVVDPYTCPACDAVLSTSEADLDHCPVCGNSTNEKYEHVIDSSVQTPPGSAVR